MPASTRRNVVAARLRIGAFAALFGGLGLQPALAQNSEAVTVDVGHCTGLESEAARLACFGAQVDAALHERPKADADERTSVIEEGDADQASRSNDERSTETAQRPERTRGSNDDLRSEAGVEGAGADEYSGTIVALRERLPNAYVITLDDGQVWQQTEPKQYPLRPGLEVRIYPTRWGGHYRLNAVGTGHHIQVRKVQ